MTRLVACVVAVVMLVAVACHSSDPIRTSTGIWVHWLQTSTGTLERRVYVIVPAQYMADASFAQAIRHAVAQGDRSPYIDFVLETPKTAPTSCPDRHCITVYRAPMNGAVASFGYTADGHMFGRAVTVGFDSAPWTQTVLNNATCHEIAGHGLGLGHSSDGTQGPCQGGLTDWDLALINIAHGHRDSTIYGATTTVQMEQEHGKLRFRTEQHGRGYYEALSHHR